MYIFPSEVIDNIIDTMDDQKDNALSINTCVQYTLVIFETRHTKAVFFARATKRILSCFYLILLQTTACVTGMSEMKTVTFYKRKCVHLLA